MPSSEWPDEATREIAREAAVDNARKRGWTGNYLESWSIRADADAAIDAAAKASPVIPAPKCETCDDGIVLGDGQRGYAHDCPDCHGTGVAEVIPVAVLRDLRAWIAKSQALPALRSQDFEAGRQLAFKAVVGWLDEHTRKEPTTPANGSG